MVPSTMSSPPVYVPIPTIKEVLCPAPAPLSVCGRNCAFLFTAMVLLGARLGQSATSNSNAAFINSGNNVLPLGCSHLSPGIAPKENDPLAPPWPSTYTYADDLLILLCLALEWAMDNDDDAGWTNASSPSDVVATFEIITNCRLGVVDGHNPLSLARRR